MNSLLFTVISNQTFYVAELIKSWEQIILGEIKL